MSYDINELRDYIVDNHFKMNDEQLKAYNSITNRINNDKNGILSNY